MTFRALRLSDSGVLWLAALLILLAGTYVVESRYQSAIAQSEARSDFLYARTISNERTVEEAPSLRKLQTTVEADLRSLSRGLPQSLTTAGLLTMLQTTGGIHHVAIVAVQPDEVQPATVAQPALSVEPWLRPTAVTIKLHGTFRDLLYFVEAVSRGRTLLEIDDAQIAVDPIETPSAKTDLDADIHTTLYRLDLPIDEERRIDAAR